MTDAPEEAIFTLERTFDAPRALVWEAFTTADHLSRWWGPAGSSCKVKAFDLKPGGRFHYGMSGPDGEISMWGLMLYETVEAPERLEFANCFANEQGEIVRAFFNDAYPLRVMNVWRFTEIDEGARTSLSVRAWPIEASEQEIAFYKGMHASMQHGFGATLDKLDTHLAEMRG